MFTFPAFDFNVVDIVYYLLLGACLINSQRVCKLSHAGRRVYTLLSVIYAYAIL